MRAARLFIVALLALTATGCVPKFPAPHAGAVPVAAAVVVPVATGPGPRYTLDTGDRLRIVVFGQEGLTNSYAVDAGGNVTMPLIGSVKARGLTSAELAAAVGARLRQGFVREPHVAVEIEAH